MATGRMTTHDDGLLRERVIERKRGRTTYVDRGGSGVAGIIIAMALLALVAFAAVFMLEARRGAAIRASAAANAASAMAKSTSNAAANDDAVGTIEPGKPAPRNQ